MAVLSAAYTNPSRTTTKKPCCTSDKAAVGFTRTALLLTDPLPTCKLLPGSVCFVCILHDIVPYEGDEGIQVYHDV